MFLKHCFLQLIIHRDYQTSEEMYVCQCASGCLHHQPTFTSVIYRTNITWKLCASPLCHFECLIVWMKNQVCVIWGFKLTKFSSRFIETYELQVGCWGYGNTVVCLCRLSCLVGFILLVTSGSASDPNSTRPKMVHEVQITNGLYHNQKNCGYICEIKNVQGFLLPGYPTCCWYSAGLSTGTERKSLRAERSM